MGTITIQAGVSATTNHPPPSPQQEVAVHPLTFQVLTGSNATQIILGMGSSGYFPGNTTSQGVNATDMTVGGLYPQGSVFMPPWGLPQEFLDNHTARVAALNSMRFLYPSFHPQQLQSASMPNPQGPIHGNQGGHTTTQSRAAPVTSSGTVDHTSSSGCSTSPGGVASISSTPSIGVSSGTPGVGPLQHPFFLHRHGQWPTWAPNEIPPSFSGARPNFELPAVIGGGILPQWGRSGGTLLAPTREDGSIQLQRVGESKKTMQRRQQRLAKKNFKVQTQQWPMTVAATADGEIDPTIRVFVHRIIRTTASRYLKLTVIKFRDHPNESLKNLKEDLDKRFIFDSNLKPNYVISFIESSMKNLRYVFHKHWLDTGRGQKHADCPEKYFPVLVKYWKTKEAEQEIRELKVERATERERLRASVEKVSASSEASDDRWSPLLEEQDPYFLKWDDSDSLMDSDSLTDISKDCLEPGVQKEIGTTTTSTTPSKNTSTPVQLQEEFGDATPNSGVRSLKSISPNQKELHFWGQEIRNVQTGLTSLTEWRATVDDRMAANARGMETLGKKLDLLLEMHASVVRAGKGKENICFNLETALRSAEGNEVTQKTDNRVHSLSARATPFTSEYTTSTSGPSQWGAPDSLTIVDGVVDSAGKRQQRGTPEITGSYTPSIVAAKTGTSKHGNRSTECQENHDRVGGPTAVETTFGSYNDPDLTQPRKCDKVQCAPSAPFKKPRIENDTGTHSKGGGLPMNVDEVEAGVAGSGRAKRNSKRPSRYLQYVPPCENKPRSDKCEPLKPKRNVWVLHPEFPNETIAIGKSGPHWRSNKKLWIPNLKGVSWEVGMQQVTIDHVYPQYADVAVLYRNHQRQGIQKVTDALDGMFAEDATIVWPSRYLKFVEP